MAGRQRQRVARGGQASGRRRTAYGNGTYVEGNTVRKLQVLPDEMPEYGRKKLSNTARKNRDKAAHMNPGYVLFLTAAMVLTGYFCLNYLQLQSDITNKVKNISRLEKELTELRAQNDEEYNRIMGTVDLEEVKRIAMEELGMEYASEDQIVNYKGESSDYVRQMKELE